MKEAIELLKSKTQYGDALSNKLESSKNRPDIEFEILFAHQCESNDLQLSYEVSINPENDKTVDFSAELNSVQLNMELVRVGHNIEISALIKASTSSGYTLTTDNKNPHFRPEAQDIKLQTSLLEKVEKFNEVSSRSINIICVDCSNVHVGRMDIDDVATVMWGKPYNPYFGARWEGERIKGMLEDNYDKRGADLFKSNISAVIFVTTLKYLPLNYAYIAFNNRLATDHVALVLETLKMNKAFTDIIRCPLP